ncbi:TetR/AcrR family transcriptional regulator [Streptomyces hainanensis]|uniref:TetR/AcrR family transcriptional regulator n=1 Tax=Streptomyces hainanensis TaxID=402648 RepID=A0A4R4TFH6_9ACTN|nr:TetR/AcrR family transcriptional regulator [Streptomyces hainanensis]TDC76331.1 TetR/AcrR family transcriptional regulator [Streptomyces hainanensis]
MSTFQGARERARREVTAAIKDEARRRVAAEGAPRLSLRAVARELGMASSALYRYFPSRDDLLTALIVDAYDAMGEAAEAGLAAAPRTDPGARWVRVCGAVRDWGLANPHEFGLVHGTPIPGYAAPRDTEQPGVRVPLALLAVAREAHEDGLLGRPAWGVTPEPVRADTKAVAAEFAPELPEPAVAALLAAWAQLIGLVSFEVFGQYNGAITAHEVFFAHAAHRLAVEVGVAAGPAAS